MFTFETQNAIGKLGEHLIKRHYESLKNDEGGNRFICRDAKFDEQMKGADLFIINQELGTRYVEVKTDTKMNDTDNFALEIMIVQEDGTKKIGAVMKTFPDYLFYWQHPTALVYWWKPEDLVPHILEWLSQDTYSRVRSENKNFFSRTLLVPKDVMMKTGVVNEMTVSYHVLEDTLADAG